MSSEMVNQPSSETMRSPTTRGTEPAGEVLNPPYNKKNHDPNPQHFIFPDCSDDLQKEFFMFYVSRCLEKNKVPFPADENTQKYFTQNVKSEVPSPSPVVNSRQAQQQQQEIQAKYRTNNNQHYQPQYYAAHNNSYIPSQTYYHYPNNYHIYNSPESTMSMGKKFVDSTTSPINPQFLDNKENHMHNRISPLAGNQNYNYNSPASVKLQDDVPPQKLNFNSPNPPPVPPHLPSSQTPAAIPNTPVMGPSLGSNSPVYVNVPRAPPPGEASHSAPPVPPRSDGVYHTPHNSAPHRPQNPMFSIPEKVGVDHAGYSGNIYHRYAGANQGMGSGGTANATSMVPNIDVRQAAIQALNIEPQLANKPPNLPPYYFPNSKKLHFNMPQNMPPPGAGGDKAIPDSLASSYLTPGDINALMRQQVIQNHHQSPFKSGLSSLKDTMGKFLGGRKRYHDVPFTAPTETPSTSGKRTKFTTEQIRILDHYYHNINKYVVGTNKATLRQMTGLELNTILMWFQNKRAREKKSKS